jgi:hypothetical protein
MDLRTEQNPGQMLLEVIHKYLCCSLTAHMGLHCHYDLLWIYSKYVKELVNKS